MLLSLIHFIDLNINSTSKSLLWLDYRLWWCSTVYPSPRPVARLIDSSWQITSLRICWYGLSILLFFCFKYLTLYLMFPSSDSNLKNLAGTLILMNFMSATPTASKSATQSLFIMLKANWNPSKTTVRLLIHVLRRPTFFFSSLFTAITVYLPPSCIFRTGLA